jgi:hypothetical protein
MPSTSIFAQVGHRTVLPSTFDLWVRGGGGCIKPHLEVIFCIFELWTEMLRCLNIIQKARHQIPAPLPYKDRGDVRARIFKL